MHEIIRDCEEMKRTKCLNIPIHEGPCRWTPGLQAEIYTLIFLPPIVQIVLCAGLSTHAVFSDKAKPREPERHAVFGGLIMQSGRLREAFGNASADRSLLGLYAVCVCCPVAELHRQYCFPVDWQLFKGPPGLNELCGKNERKMGEETTQDKQIQKKQGKVYLQTKG